MILWTARRADFNPRGALAPLVGSNVGSKAGSKAEALRGLEARRPRRRV